MNPNQPPSARIELNKTTPLLCTSCKNQTFRASQIFRLVPGLMIGSKNTMAQPIDVWICERCGTICDSPIVMSPVIKEQLDKEAAEREAKFVEDTKGHFEAAKATVKSKLIQ